MSLALVQDYSSEEEAQETYLSDSDDEGPPDQVAARPIEMTIHSKGPDLKKGSLLPSAHDVFSEVTGPPEFLKSIGTDSVPNNRSQSNYLKQSASSQASRISERPSPPAAAVVEAKAQLVAIRERVSSGIENASQEETYKASNVGPAPSQDAAKLLSLCPQCSVPKTYSSTRGMFCPVCKDQPGKDMEDEKKRGSRIKDKEKSKRMKGQSSHATWKSETEMHLRQQFD